MSGRILTALGICILAALWVPHSRAAVATSGDLQRVCDEFSALELDPARAHDLSGAVIARDVATVRLNKGILIFSKRIEGVTPAAVFLGEGSFTMTPVRRMDREMLDIAATDHLGEAPGGMINTELTQAVLFGHEAVWKEIGPSLGEARPATPDELGDGDHILREQIEVGDKYFPPDAAIGHEIGAAGEFSVISEALDDPAEPGDTLRAEMKTGLGWLSFGWVPSSTYEVRLGTRSAIGAFLDYHPLVHTHRKDDLDEKGNLVADSEADRKEVMKVRRYRMDLEIPDLERIDIDVSVTFTPSIEGLRPVAFSLINDVEGPRWDSRAKYVDTLHVKDEAGNELPFLHRKNSILILPAEPLTKGGEVTWDFKLSERTITQFSDNHFSLLNTFPWFPQYGYMGGDYEYDWTIKIVKPYTATGSGKVVDRWEEEGLNAARMIFERPVWLPSIIFGRYQAEEDEYESQASGGTVHLAAHSWPQTNYFIGADTASVTVPRNKPRDVLEEGKEILKFMEDLYGPFPYDKLDIAMMAPGMGFGQAPPALVQLTGEAFMSSAEIANLNIPDRRMSPDFIHWFFAHEISHQWWAHKIKWATWEDTWLSESFAEYSAGLYVLALQGKQKFLEKLRDWEENARIADPHGSVAWCTNLSGTRGFQWSTQLIYYKGPYVVHMLRMMMGAENFTKAMKAVFEKHAHEMVTTDVIQEECEKLLGYSLDFFFDQWFRGHGIPVFDYSWETTEAEDGTWLVTVRISQRDKKNFKQVLMPVYFYFKGQDDPLVRPRPLTEPDHVYRLKLPQKPERVVLDVDNDILGDVILAEGSGL